MKIESSIDINKQGQIVEDETGRIVTTYELDESDYVRKSICTCKHYRFKGMEADCRLYSNNDEEVGHLKLPNGVIWHCYTDIQPVSITKDNRYLILPGIGIKESACFDIRTNALVWEWPKDFFYIYVSGNYVFAEWCLTSKGGIKVFDVETGEIVKEVMKYNTKHLHPDIYRLNKQYLFIYSQGGIFLLDMASDKMFMSKKVFKDMHEDVRVRHIEIDEETNSLKLSLVNVGLMPACGIDNGLGWEYKEISISMNEMLDDIKESPLGIKIPTTIVGVERAYKKLFE